MCGPPALSSHTKNCALKREVRINSVMTCGMGIAGRWPPGRLPALPRVNNNLGPLSPFQKVQPGPKHSHRHDHAPHV